MIKRLAEDTQTLFAELLTTLLAQEGERGWAHLAGSFSTKRVKGAEYVYFQYSDPGGAKRQFAVGRKGPQIDAIVSAYAAQRAHFELDAAQVRRLAGLLRSAGLPMVPHGPSRVIRALGDAGVFAIGGILVGSYAFQIIGSLLGVEWPGAAWRTQDIDIASHLRIAIPNTHADIPKTLESLRMGFIPTPQFDPRHPSTSYRIRGKSLSLDLITPGTDQDVSPIMIPRFNAAAAPIKYLSLLMTDSQPTVAVADSSATLVVVPAPARFALHKLLVSQTRSTIEQTKSGKDLHQAALLLEALTKDRPLDLEDAARSFAKSGPAVTCKVMRGLEIAIERWPGSAASATIIQPILAN